MEELSKQVENTVGKGEIARYEQFLLYPVFTKGLFPGASKGVIVWEWVKEDGFWKRFGKRDNACNELPLYSHNDLYFI